MGIVSFLYRIDLLMMTRFSDLFRLISMKCSMLAIAIMGQVPPYSLARIRIMPLGVTFDEVAFDDLFN